MYDYVDEVGGGGRSDLFNALRKPHNAFFFLVQGIYTVRKPCIQIIARNSGCQLLQFRIHII